MSESEILDGWLCKLRRALARDIVEELGQGQWLDQHHSVLGRNKHVRLAKRLIRECSTDALYSEDGKWMVRRSAVDQEIARINSEEPPAALRQSDRPPPVKTEGMEPEDDTGVYERDLLRKWQHR